jgi:hypothetical protein
MKSQTKCVVELRKFVVGKIDVDFLQRHICVIVWRKFET